MEWNDLTTLAALQPCKPEAQTIWKSTDKSRQLNCYYDIRLQANNLDMTKKRSYDVCDRNAVRPQKKQKTTAAVW